MHGYDLIFTLAGGLSAALVLGYLTHRLGLSPIVGYLLAGTLVGPHTPGFVADTTLAEQLAEIGVILLMFGVGLTFHLDELLSVRRVAVPGAVGQSLAATLLGALLVHALGWSWSAGLVFGLALAVASTVVLVRVLADHHDLHTTPGRIAVGWLVVEDVFTVVALVLLPALLGHRDQSTPVWWTLGAVALEITALIAVAALVGTRVIPRVLDIVARTRSRELFTLSVLAIALGLAVGASVIFSVSMALGAFIAGMIVGRSEFSLRAASEALPMRDAFAVLFFVSVGMLLDPAGLLDAPLLTGGALLVVLVAKPLVAFAFVWFLRYPMRVSLTVAIALGQIGEFSFILATIGREVGLLTAVATNAIVAASIVSIVLNPLLYRSIPAIERRIARWARPPRSPTGAGEDPTAAVETPDPWHAISVRDRAVVVGYGPTGRAVVGLLRENGIAPTVIDLNVDTVRALRQEGVAAVYGDATQPETLAAAGVASAGSLILTSAGMDNSESVIRAARECQPGVRVLARVGYLRDLPALTGAGADTVYAGEGEVALAFVEDILRDLGATPDQIERERARAHDVLFGALARPIEREVA